MKKIFLILTQFVWLTAASAQHKGHNMPAQKQSNQQTEKDIYTCVMHLEVQMGKPGKCPKCGMTLVKKTIRGTAETADAKVEGNANVERHREDVPIANLLPFNFMVNTDKEYAAGFRYMVSKLTMLPTWA